MGGVIKGVGRLAMKVGQDAAENRKILGEVIGFLNRVGHGNAQKWLKALDVLKYPSELISKFKGFCEGIATTISEILKARVGGMLPDRLRAMLSSIGDGMLMLRDLGVSYIPQGLKELNLKLKVLQEIVYEGEVHLLATGEKTITREVEAQLIEKEVRAAVKAGKWPQNLVDTKTAKPSTFGPIFNKIRTAHGWPDLLRSRTCLPGHATNVEYFHPLCTFCGKINAWEAKEFAGKTIYRVFGNAGKLASESKAEGFYWGVGAMPESGQAWRKFSAVLDEWNANGFIVLVTFPSLDMIKKEIELENALKGWFGTIAEQFGDKIKNQYLEGGGHQVGMGMFPAKLQDAIHDMGVSAKEGHVAAQNKHYGCHY